VLYYILIYILYNIIIILYIILYYTYTHVHVRTRVALNNPVVVDSCLLRYMRGPSRAYDSI
jgi:hypothetical protein